MQPFQFKLSNGGTVAGLHSIPPASTSPVKDRPLIVGLHGGCYDSKYFKGTPKFSASIASQAFGVPFVSIDRPSYGGTSCILPVPEGSDFYAETGRWLHQYILPTLWAEIGVPSQCNSIVLLAHSLGVMGGIVATALHAQDNEPLYPLSGLIANGMGNTQSTTMKTTPPSNISIDENHVLFPVEKKDGIMFKPGTVAQEILDLCEHFNAVSPVPEIYQFPTMWLPIWKEKWAAQVSVPLLFALVEDDPFFVADEAELEICARAFEKSVHVERVLLRDAPHCMELSYWSQAWYARCFGFAMECSASFSVRV
jgi:pimeloyl-ACP methyl ester carboxylesterase